MPSTKSIVLALALTAPAAALVPPATQRVPATIRHADDAARAARREALMQASERAAARIEATRNSGQSTPMRPDDMMAFVKPATEAQAPDEMSYVPTDDEGRANYAVGGGESGMDRSSMKERFSRAPEGHTPHYNTGGATSRTSREIRRSATGRRTTARRPATTPSSASSASARMKI